jgi:phosphomannomutase
VHFGTDGWRAIIGDDFNTLTVARVAAAAATIFREDHPAPVSASAPAAAPASAPGTPAGSPDPAPNTIIIGYDTREDAGRYAVLAATVLASYGFDIVISDAYCPTPTLCWSVASNPAAVGGVMLTSSHNPAEYLGIKLRMSDGGASPASFTARVEAALNDQAPACYAEALANFEVAVNGTPDAPARPLARACYLHFSNLVAPYLTHLAASVDVSAIAAAKLRVVVDPLFGAGRGYLAGLLTQLGVTVVEVNGAQDSSFDGLHPEPIAPWIKRGAQKVVELSFDACFITDGDADRIGAVDAQGSFVNPHRILALVIAHLVEDKKLTGRVVRTLSGSNLIRLQCERLGLPLTTTPIGFKWIYEQMLAGDVLVGGEESGGIGIPTHVRERDGLLMALLLTELMAQRGQTLQQLVSNMLAQLGGFEYARRDLRLSSVQKEAFLAAHVALGGTSIEPYTKRFESIGQKLGALTREDGLKLEFVSGAWLLMRPSGTEPLVRVYAEAPTHEQVEALLNVGCALVTG